MTKTIEASNQVAIQLDNQFVPLGDFFKIMAKSKESPYQSEFSFLPFIEKMKGKKLKDKVALNGSSDVKMFSEFEKQLRKFSDPKALDDPEKRQAVMCVLFPSLFFEGQIGFVGKPFTKEFFYMTPAMQEVFTSGEWEVKITSDLKKGKMGSPAMEAGKMILNTFYDQQIESSSYDVMTFRDKKTKLEKHFKTNIILDYIKTTPLKPLAKLGEEQIYDLFNHWKDEAYWLENFPPENFQFEGMVIGYLQDVTDVTILSEMKEMMVSDEKEKEDNCGGYSSKDHLTNLLRSYLKMPDLEFGSMMNRNFKYAQHFSWSLLGGIEEISKFKMEDFENCSFKKTVSTGEPFIIGDLKKLKNPSGLDRKYSELGYRSLLLAPLRNNEEEIIGIMELASKKPYRFHKQILWKMEEVVSLFSLGTNRWVQALDNSVNLFIQKQFTYIHPSVEWKFIDVSNKFIFSTQENGKPVALEPIVFKNVYPLYGQADIVGSSKIRNESIQSDMLDNLQRVQKVIKLVREKIEFQLLDIFFDKSEAFSKRLEDGGYVSSDESQIVDLLTQDIHPLLRELGEKYSSSISPEILKNYFDYLDPRLDIVYRKRKDYEDSVHEINEMISNYIDQEVAKKQEVMPHFFEKYITDGVEYNIYLGQSLLENGTFSEYFLKDFRLWQLIQMCEITRLVEDKGKDLLVPLTTAQLIFIYNNALSIRFNMDEKQFDVDGAYNVRYEILKKRIDKAVIKGTRERLTQKGKVAIVWLQEKDRLEYLEYLHHLQRQGYITDEIEELELEKLQGADGLKALRVSVK